MVCTAWICLLRSDGLWVTCTRALPKSLHFAAKDVNQCREAEEDKMVWYIALMWAGRRVHVWLLRA